MKTIYLLLSLSLLLFSVSAQSGLWTWLQGSNTFNNPGNFGTQGVPSPSNGPSALYEPCEWTDRTGNFWLYGGLDYNSGVQIHNDLWKYDPRTNEWTWVNGIATLNDHGNYGVKGVPSPTNRPPGLGYGVPTWVDSSGNFWMFGGWNDSTYADLWKYDIGTNEWTWINGPGKGNPPGIYGSKGVPDTANYPPPRSECAASWTDNAGDLWMFGGYMKAGLYYNDLWRYNIASNKWRWMKGSNLTNQKGVWGNEGVEDSANVPSARQTYCHWKDASGNLWMFGGGVDTLNRNRTLNDLWRYNPPTNNWTWMNGRNVSDSTYVGSYGAKCVMDSSNQPPPRYENRSAWTDVKGNFWMFGGQYQTSPLDTFTLNDLWMYCVASNQWTWVSGDSIPNQAGIWGTLGVPGSANNPGSRLGSVSWKDFEGNLYLFGGSSATFGNLYNDLWRFEIDSTCVSGCSSFKPCSANFSLIADTTQLHHYIGTNNVTGKPPISYIWSWGDGSYDSIPYPSHTYADSGFYNICLSITDSTGCQSTFCDSSFHALRTTNTMVYITIVNPLTTGTKEVSLQTSQVTIYPNPTVNQLIIHNSSFQNEAVTISIFNLLGQETSPKESGVLRTPPNPLQRRGEDTMIDVSKLPAGMYFLQMKSESGSVVKKFVKE